MKFREKTVNYSFLMSQQGIIYFPRDARSGKELIIACFNFPPGPSLFGVGVI